MQAPSTRRLFTVVVDMGGGMTRTIKVKASSREVAERRALKRTGGVSIVRPS